MEDLASEILEISIFFSVGEKNYVDLMCGIKSVGELPWPAEVFQGDLFVSPPGQSGNVDIGF